MVLTMRSFTMEQPRRASEVCRSSIARARHHPYCHTTTISSRIHLAPSTEEDRIDGCRDKPMLWNNDVSPAIICHTPDRLDLCTKHKRGMSRRFYFSLSPPPRLSKSARCPNLLDSKCDASWEPSRTRCIGKQTDSMAKISRETIHTTRSQNRPCLRAFDELCVRGDCSSKGFTLQ